MIALVSGEGWHVQDLQRASARLELPFETILFDRLECRLGGEEASGAGFGVLGDPRDLADSSGVLVRLMPPGSLEQVVYRMDVLHGLEAAGVPVINAPRAVEAAVDKYLALARARTAGLPVPETWVGERSASALEAFERLGGDVVIKPLFGSEGRGLLRVSDRELARRAFVTLERLGAVLYLQRFVPHPGHDARVFILAGCVLAAMKRHAAAGEWRTNIAVGGRPERIAVGREPELEELALRAAAALGARVAGVDLIREASGRWLVLEINAVPGWRALSEVSGIDVAAAVLSDLWSLRR